jgi:hypothetical protein
VNNHGNYALVELNEKSAKKLGVETRTAFTPLKKRFNNNSPSIASIFYFNLKF